MRENDKNVKVFFTFNIIAAGVLLAGCVTGKSGITLDTVGPVPAQPAAISSTNGTLEVYSAYEVNADFNSRDPYRPEYSDYRIFTTDGKLLQRVHNNSGTILEDPVSVELPPGKYHVFARANGYGYVTIPVIIKPEQSTVLHLEGGVSSPGEAGFNPTNAVCLPDRQVVGWRAPEEYSSKL